MLAQAQKDRIVAILDATADLVIATIREDGWPQATAVSFVNDGSKIYFGTSTLAQKARNIARDDRVSVSLTAPYAHWDQIRGISIGGRARRVTDPDEMARVGALMLKKFPQITSYVLPGEAGDLALFRIDPDVISLLDYSQGFGHTEALTPG